MVSVLLLFMLVAIVTSQYCGRYVSACTGYGNYGQKIVYKVGVDNDTVSSIQQMTRYYSSSDCSDSPVLVITSIYDVKINSTRRDYTNEYILHRGTVSDYRILSTNVDYLSLLGITCSPSLKNNVEVSLKVTTCSSSLGIFEGSDFIGSTSYFFIQFPSISVLRISTTLPIIGVNSYDRVDSDGCLGCKATDLWKASEVGESQKTFCPSTQAGYVFMSCVIGSTGNGMWSGQSVSECSEIVSEPKLESGEGYFRGTIVVNIDPDLFTADEHEYMMDLLRQQVINNDLPSKAFTAEGVHNVHSLSTTASPSKSVEIDFRVTGDKSKVKKALNSITSVMDKGSLHKKMIIRNQIYFDVTMSFDDDEIEIISNNTTTVIVVITSVVIVILLVVVIVLMTVLLKTRPKTKKGDIESGSESYSDSYSEYSDYSSEDEPSV